MINFEKIAEEYGTPVYVYDKMKLKEQAEQILAVPAPYGLTVRYAMKANPYNSILEYLKNLGIEIDASSSYEVERALALEFKPEQILLTSQQLAHNLVKLTEKGVQFNACSLRQLEEYGKVASGSEVSVRINPGVGSGHSAKTNVGGVTSSFGIWHEYIAQVHAICQKYKLKIKRLHTHIGSGADAAVWQEVIRTSLETIKNFPEATIINLGGGFKVARMPEETGADMEQIGERLAKELKQFSQETGRKLHLELEPGTFMVANVGTLLARVDDVVNTGSEGYNFIKLNTGMNDMLRPSLYGAQHPIEVLNDSKEKLEYVVVGHNCESGDLFTPAPGEPEVLRSRLLNKASVSDLVAIGGTGAYCASMAAHGYNNFPDAKELMV